jgi:LemA protein
VKESDGTAAFLPFDRRFCRSWKFLAAACNRVDNPNIATTSESGRLLREISRGNMRTATRFGFIAVLLAAAIALSGCGYNTLQTQDEQVKAAWSQVLNQYQRRADLIPNLVNTVKGAVSSEKEILDAVVNARAKVGSIQATPDLINHPEEFKKWQAAQGELTTALSRLMVVVERYPDLKSISGFNDLQAQIEGTENRIANERRRYIEAVQAYNVTVRSFPTNLTAMMFHQELKPNFTVENEAAISKPPTVDFGTTPPKQ